MTQYIYILYRTIVQQFHIKITTFPCSLIMERIYQIYKDLVVKRSIMNIPVEARKCFRQVESEGYC